MCVRVCTSALTTKAQFLQTGAERNAECDFYGFDSTYITGRLGVRQNAIVQHEVSLQNTNKRRSKST